MGVKRTVLSLLLLAGCIDSPHEGGGGDAGGQSIACEGNLVLNGSFDESTVGWLFTAATLAMVEDGADGTPAVEICFNGDAGDFYFSIDDAMPAVAEPVTGESYELTAWVRHSGETAPRTVLVAVREWDVEGGDHPAVASITPDGEWREVSSFLTVTPDAAEVDVYAAVLDPDPGDCFQLDALCLQRVE